MCRNPSRIATAIALLASAGVIAAPGAAAAWPFGGAVKAAASHMPSQGVASAAASPTPAPPAKASVQERLAADRLDPLARSAFWAREADIDPSDVQAGVELSSTLRALGRWQEAADASAKVLIANPADPGALLEQAKAWIGADKGFYALAPLRKAAAATPRDWRVYSLMAVAHEQNKQPDLARAAYAQALALAPDNPAVLSNLGLWYATHGQAAQGETYLRRAVAAPGALAQERQNLALVLGMEGKLGEAEQIMREDLPPEVADNNLAYLQALNLKTAGAAMR